MSEKSTLSPPNLVVQIIVGVSAIVRCRAACCRTLLIAELEGLAETALLLQLLREHLVLADVRIGHRPSGELHGLLKVLSADLGDRVHNFILHSLLSALLALPAGGQNAHVLLV